MGTPLSFTIPLYNGILATLPLHYTALSLPSAVRNIACLPYLTSLEASHCEVRYARDGSRVPVELHRGDGHTTTTTAAPSPSLEHSFSCPPPRPKVRPLLTARALYFLARILVMLRLKSKKLLSKSRGPRYLLFKVSVQFIHQLPHGHTAPAVAVVPLCCRASTVA